MTLEEYKNILITGTPSDRARAIAEAGNDRSLTDEEFHELTAMIKGVVRPGRRKRWRGPASGRSPLSIWTMSASPTPIVRSTPSAATSGWRKRR